MPRSLDLLQFQPIRFGFSPELCANTDTTQYCNMVQDGDAMNWQVKRILGTDLTCAITDVSSVNIPFNPDFTGSAVFWTLTGGWSYGGNAISITANSGTVTQGLLGLATGRMYKVEVVTTATTTGDDLDVLLSGTMIGFIPIGSIAGTYSFYGLANLGVSADLQIRGTAITTVVTAINVYRASPCYTFDVISGTVAFDPVLGLSINGTVNIAVSLTFEPSSWYSPKTTINITDFQEGEIEVSYGTDFSGPQAGSNGAFTWTNNDNILSDVGIALQDFIGNITSITFQQLSSDYYFSLHDIDGTYVTTLNPYLTYCREWITGYIDPFAESIFGYGCYKIHIYDPFQHNDQITFEYDFTTLAVPWTEVGAAWSLTGNGYEFDASVSLGEINTSEVSAATFAAAWTKFAFETGTLSGAGIGLASMSASLLSNGVDIINGYSVTPNSDTIYQSANEGDPNGNFGLGINPYMTVNGAIPGDHYEIKNAYYKIYPYHKDYESNCITYQQSFGCTKLIYAIPGNNMGFNSSQCPFTIMKRFSILRITPQYKIAATDFIGSDGTRVLVSGTMQKFSTVLFDYMDELGHDVVAAIIMCKEVYIHDTLANITVDGTRYFVLPQDYVPEWVGNQDLNGARGRILLMEYNQVKFVTNCD